jgi:N-methylhydantoinase A
VQTAKIGTQLMILNGREVPVPVFDRGRLGVSSEIDGPAIITQLDTTILVEQRWKLGVHVSGAVILELT